MVAARGWALRAAICAGLLGLATLGCRPAATPADEGKALERAIAAASETMQAHRNNTAFPVDEADLPDVVRKRLAAFDAQAADAHGDADGARYAALRRILEARIAEDLRVGMAVRALVDVQASGYELALDPGALARFKHATADFAAAVDRLHADHAAGEALVAKELGSAAFPREATAPLREVVDKGALSDAPTLAIATDLLALAKAREAALDYLAAHPGHWQIQDGGLNFNDGAIAGEFAALDRAVQAARVRFERSAATPAPAAGGK